MFYSSFLLSYYPIGRFISYNAVPRIFVSVIAVHTSIVGIIARFLFYLLFIPFFSWSVLRDCASKYYDENMRNGYFRYLQIIFPFSTTMGTLGEVIITVFCWQGMYICFFHVGMACPLLPPPSSRDEIQTRE